MSDLQSIQFTLLTPLGVSQGHCKDSMIAFDPCPQQRDTAINRLVYLSDLAGTEYNIDTYGYRRGIKEVHEGHRHCLEEALKKGIATILCENISDGTTPIAMNVLFENDQGYLIQTAFVDRFRRIPLLLNKDEEHNACKMQKLLHDMQEITTIYVRERDRRRIYYIDDPNIGIREFWRNYHAMYREQKIIPELHLPSPAGWNV